MTAKRRSYNVQCNVMIKSQAMLYYNVTFMLYERFTETLFSIGLENVITT